MTGGKPFAVSAALATLICLCGPAIAEDGDQFKGEKLIDIGASPAAVVAYNQALTTLSLKKRALERKKQLFQQQLATQEDIEKAEKDVADTEMQVEIYEKLLMSK